MRHLITWADYSVTEIRRILEIASDLKELSHRRIRPAILERKVLGLLFAKPSLRTRVSFEALANQTGASSLFLGEEVGWGSREPAHDFFPVLTSYIDCLVIRANRHQDVVEASKFSRCPVINGLTNLAHPCQALADVMTIEEISGTAEGLKIAYVGDANNVAFSLALLSCKLGARFSIAAPPGYAFAAERVADIQAQVAYPGRFQQTEDPARAVQGANIVYTDVWTSMGQEKESAQRIRDFESYQVNDMLLQHAADDVRFMHCLPAKRGEEVTSDVIDGERSITLQQAENRLHAQKGAVVWLLTEAEVNQ